MFGSAASAHPLGNFTINHLAKVHATATSLNVRYILDIAEIPAFQIMRAQNARGVWNPAAARAWGNDEIAVVARGLSVRVDGNPVTLTAASTATRTRPGAGGLPILYWVGEFRAPLRAGPHALAIEDRVYEDRRIGWKDVVVFPQVEPTQELQGYPSALIGSPRTNTLATFHLDAQRNVSQLETTSSAVPQQASTASIVRQTLLSEMFLRADQGPLWILITILAAFGFGALHAIEPGHGKALLAFTLVGARATNKQAAVLAASLTFAHTIGVVILGIVLFFATGFVPETIYPWITLVSGIAIALIGGRALARYIQGVRPFAHAHVHQHDRAAAHDHAHDHRHALTHAHGHDHVHTPHDELSHTHGGSTHTHAVPGNEPLKFGSAVWAAMSGGIAPCPAAIILLIAAVNSHRIAYGLLLVVVFGLGLACVLTGLGLAVVRGAAWLSSNRKYERAVRFGPLASAALISIIGSVLLGQGFVQIGIHTSVIAIATLTLCAIGGYAYSAHHHGRHTVVPAA